MAHLHKIVSDLRAELAAQLPKLPLRRSIDPRLKFTEHKSEDNNKDIKSTSADARTFELSAPLAVQETQINANTSHPVFALLLTVAYPSTQQWEAAALDEINYIRSWLNRNPSNVSGVSARFVRPSDLITSEKSTDDARKFWGLTITVHSEVTL